MAKLMIEQGWIPDNFKVEDGGDARIYEMDDPGSSFFVRLHSWKDHSVFEHFQGKRVRVTVETVDEKSG